MSLRFGTSAQEHKRFGDWRLTNLKELTGSQEMTSAARSDKANAEGRRVRACNHLLADLTAERAPKRRPEAHRIRPRAPQDSGGTIFDSKYYILRTSVILNQRSRCLHFGNSAREHRLACLEAQSRSI